MLTKTFPSNGSYNPPLIRFEPEIILQRKYSMFYYLLRLRHYM